MSGFAYATLVSHDSELLPVFLLAHSLRKHGSQYPLVVLYARSMVSDDVREALELEAKYLTFTLEAVDGSSPSQSPDGIEGSNQLPIVAGRLGVFSPPLWNYEMICYLAPNSLMVSHGMDLVFSESRLPTSEWLAATYLCTCETEKRSRKFSVPDSGLAQACPYLHSTPRGIRSMSITLATLANDRPRRSLLDPGMFVFYPGEQLWDQISGLLRHNKEHDRGQLSNREVLADVFRDRWMPLLWSYYASEAMRSCHPDFWNTHAVTCIRYRMEDSWVSARDGTTGSLNNSSSAPQSWITAFDDWQGARKGKDEGERLLQVIGHQYLSSGEKTDIASTENWFDESSATGTLSGAHFEGDSEVPSTSTEAPFQESHTSIFQNEALVERGHSPAAH